jgi:hypothetical protein
MIIKQMVIPLKMSRDSDRGDEEGTGVARD